jgi:serine/threonine protein kinase
MDEPSLTVVFPKPRNYVTSVWKANEWKPLPFDENDECYVRGCRQWDWSDTDTDETEETAAREVLLLQPLELLGRGSHGVVFRCVVSDGVESRKERAVKFCIADDAFERECKISALLDRWLTQPFVGGNDNIVSAGSKRSRHDVNGKTENQWELVGRCPYVPRTVRGFVLHRREKSQRVLPRSWLDQRDFRKIFHVDLDQTDDNVVRVGGIVSEEITRASSLSAWSWDVFERFLNECNPEGPTLRGYIWTRVAFQLAYALASLHRSHPRYRVLHGDVNGRNILMETTATSASMLPIKIGSFFYDPSIYIESPQPQATTIRLIDFSLAWSNAATIPETSSLTESSSSMDPHDDTPQNPASTYDHRPPELCFFRHDQTAVYTEKSEVWSAGMVLLALALSGATDDMEHDTIDNVLPVSLLSCATHWKRFSEKGATKERSAFIVSRRLLKWAASAKLALTDTDNSDNDNRFPHELLNNVDLYWNRDDAFSSVIEHAWLLWRTLGEPPADAHRDMGYSGTLMHALVTEAQRRTTEYVTLVNAAFVRKVRDILRVRLSADQLALLASMLDWNPRCRPTTTQILTRPEFSELFKCLLFQYDDTAKNETRRVWSGDWLLSNVMAGGGGKPEEKMEGWHADSIFAGVPRRLWDDNNNNNNTVDAEKKFGNGSCGFCFTCEVPCIEGVLHKCASK